ncbi:MAG TPA: hypothetical protein VM686_08470 [Polyangiaceae bacterium]|jgi:hypothetical protein|nr:hypothetical protein [Polyangiaceae bacterium]
MGRSLRLKVVALVAGVFVFTFASAAFAQGVKDIEGGGAAAGGGGDEGYGYQFEDDPLAAGGFGPNDATIKVRPKAARTTLIRPRTTFVPEMLKSVENI